MDLTNILMGVSLSNKVFNRAFAKKFFDWIIANKVEHALVVIFDSCEVVNIRVFKSLAGPEAQKSSEQRTQELKTMFESVLSKDRVTVDTQSHVGTSMSSLPDLIEKLHQGYEQKKIFYQDVREQIRINLLVKAKTIGQEIINNNLDALSEYIILELAWFYAFFEQDTQSTTEVYPGPELFTKRKLIQGQYVDETGIPKLKKDPMYVNLDTLIVQ